MEILKDSKGSQWALIIGLIFLIAPVFVSLTLISQLDEVVAIRHEALETKDLFDTLEFALKDLVILRAKNSKRPQTEKIKLAETEINKSFGILATKFAKNSEQYHTIKMMQDYWMDASREKNTLKYENFEIIDEQLLVLDAAQDKIIDSHNASIYMNTRNLSSYTTLSFFLGLILIAFALYSKNKQSKNRIALIDELNRLRTEAVSASNLKSKFLSTVSHEIRTPLNGIIGLSDVLLHKKPSTNDKIYANAIHQSGKTLLCIINDILDFSKIESGRFELEKEEFSIVEVLDQVLFTLVPKATEKSISLDYEIADNVPKTVTGDSGRLSQVLFNLIGNAIKFTSKGYVLVQINALSNIEDDDSIKIHFSVEDTGEGLTKEEMKNLFLPFIQGKRAGTSGEYGTGLGLSISQHIIGAMNGTIKATSEYGRGSKFWFEITLENPSEERIGFIKKFKKIEQVAHDEDSRPLFSPEQHRKVLIAEDNPTNQIVAQSMLTQLGIIPTVAADGREAIDLAIKSRFDVILMDCQMPIMDGFESTRRLRAAHIATPIIAMTANVSKENEKLCLEAGMTDFLPKPITLESLKTILKKHIVCPVTASNATLDNLKSAIGDKATSKVVSIFISSLSEFQFRFLACLENQDIVGLQRLGHKYKSSALTVGATQFAEICKKMESATDIDVARSHQKKISQLMNDAGAMLSFNDTQDDQDPRP